ncbi:MAG TPA: hypothetical protein VK675_03370 [Candidatus Paceibacterota bacterium]|nr:hypothetical protein [Candidatus Paceibacterota bacterium]
MKKIQNGAAYVFIVSVFILAVISVCGVWKIFSGDVITKSIQTFGLLSIVAVIVIIAGRFIDSREQLAVSNTGAAESVPFSNPVFKNLRQITVAVLIISISLLALLGVLAIWDVLSGEVLNKSLSSITIIAFASIVIVVTCLEREKNKLMRQKLSGGVILLLLILGWIFLSFLFYS